MRLKYQAQRTYWTKFSITKSLQINLSQACCCEMSINNGVRQRGGWWDWCRCVECSKQSVERNLPFWLTAACAFVGSGFWSGNSCLLIAYLGPYYWLSTHVQNPLLLYPQFRICHWLLTFLFHLYMVLFIFKAIRYS